MIFDTLLITGCGGDTAMAMGRIAKESGAIRRLVGCDVHPHHAGKRVCDVFELLPRAEDAGYVAALSDVARRHGASVIVPTTDAEIRRLLNDGLLETIDGCPVVAPNAVAIRAGLDKFETNRVMVSNGLPAPWTRLAGREKPEAFPCVLKPRYGRGGRGVVRVEADDVEQYAAVGDTHIWQELILPEDQEYTCGLYRTADGETRTITFRRWLQDGLTYAAEVAEIPAIDKLLVKIAEAVGLVGAINVQLRLAEDGPKVFEINPRFSSTVGFRHKVGFRDFIWSLFERRNLKIESYCPPAVGTTLYRMTIEVI